MQSKANRAGRKARNPVTASPETASPETAVADKPATPVAAKPDLAAINAAKAALFIAARNVLAVLYSGASPVVHRGEITPRDTLVSRVSSPVQRIGKAGPTERDNSALAAYHAFTVIAGETGATILAVASDYGADIGATSRLASAGFLAVDTDPDNPDYVSIRLNGDGIKRASAAFNRLNPEAVAAMRDAYNAALAAKR